MIEGSNEPLDRAIRAQAFAAVEEADVIIFLVDAKEGPHPMDERIAEILRKAQKPVLLVVNKVDNLGRPDESSWMDFWSLGMGEPLPVAASSGKGTGDLLDKVLAALPDAPTESGAPDEVRVAVVGRPNVGKSSFVNRIFGEERMVVSEVAGTTRDPVDSPLIYHGQTLVFVDTAIPGRVPAFEEIEAEVRSAWLNEQKASAWEKAYKDLRAKYTVVLSAPPGSPLASGAGPLAAKPAPAPTAAAPK